MRSPTITIGSGLVLGVDAIPVSVEATLRHASDGTPRLLGLVDTCVREAYHRVLQAFFALGLPQPRGVITVNFAPASLKKEGSGFDLPLALALAGSVGLFPPERARGLFAWGEINLEGRILPARGAVSVALAARGARAPILLTGLDDATLCAAVEGLQSRGASTLADAVYWLAGRRELPAPPPPRPGEPTGPSLDFADLHGHETPKRALAVAAAGGHNLLMSGPPGSGKSALARRLPGILPPPTPAERLEILQVHAAAGLPLPPADQRPMRAPHHTSSTVSLIGGGHGLRPGEITLAHRGVLFLDELPEFRRDVLEAMRQPLEDGVVTVGRARRTVTMPARFGLLAAMNPCPCGYLGHPRRPCRCSMPLIRRYRHRLSGPLLDRIDLQIEVPVVDPADYESADRGRHTDSPVSTAALRHAVLAARGRQRERAARLGHGLLNAELDGRLLHRSCRPTAPALRLLERILRAEGASGRTRVRLLRTALTLADLRGADRVDEEDLLEASALRRGIDEDPP